MRALAELVVIIVGVLTALGVDEWREERGERVLEAQYLQGLATDVRQDMARMDVLDVQILNRISGATRLLQELGEDASFRGSGSTFPDRSGDEARRRAGELNLFEAISLAGRVFLLDTSSPTFDELRSTGHLQLIQDAELKRSISEYYRAVESSHHVDGHQELVVWTEYHGLLSDHGIAAFDTNTPEADLRAQLQRIPNLGAMVRRVRSVFLVQDIYSYPSPIAVATNASEIPPATAARPEVCSLVIAWNALMMPTVVPNNPTNGAVAPMVARPDRPRFNSAFTIASARSQARRDASICSPDNSVEAP